MALGSMRRDAAEVVEHAERERRVGAGEPAQGVAAVRAPVEVGAAFLRVDEPAVGGHVPADRRARDAEEADRADRAVIDQLLGADADLVVAGLARDRAQQPGVLRRGDDLRRTRSTLSAIGFSMYTCLPAATVCERERQVRRVGRGDDDDVDVLAIEERVDGWARPGR